MTNLKKSIEEFTKSNICNCSLTKCPRRAEATTDLLELLEGAVQTDQLPDYKQEYKDQLITEASYHYFRGRDFERTQLLDSVRSDK